MSQLQVTNSKPAGTVIAQNPLAGNKEKQALICRGARAWLRMLDRPEVPFRFDIVEVLMRDGEPSFTLLKSAFQLPETQRR